MPFGSTTRAPWPLLVLLLGDGRSTTLAPAVDSGVRCSMLLPGAFALCLSMAATAATAWSPCVEKAHGFHAVRLAEGTEHLYKS